MRPLRAYGAHVSIVALDAYALRHAQAVFGIHHQVYGKAYRQIRAYGGIERHQDRAQRIVYRGGVRHGAVEDGFAVFAFADLEKRRVLGGGDEIAFVVNRVQLRRLAANLAADEEIAAKHRVLGMADLLRIVGDLAGTAANQLRRIEQSRHVEQILVDVVLYVLLQ